MPKSVNWPGVFLFYNGCMNMRDQPTIFSDNVTIRVSNISDGTMSLKSLPESPDEVWDNQRRFIESAGGRLDQTAFVYVTYDDGDDFCRYREAKADDFGTTTNQPCDALITQTKGVGLFLPVADCCAVVLYDPVTKTLMLSHVGRHSVEQYGARKSVEYLTSHYEIDSKNLMAWLSPAAGADSYPIFARDNRSLHDLIIDDLAADGVSKEHIEVSLIDTTTDTNYFSYSEYKQGKRPADGGFAVFAMMSPRS